MSLPSQAWGTLHPSVFRHAAEPVRRVQATLRPSGAIRYCCPDTGSFVLITDAATLAGLQVHDLRQEPEAVYETMICLLKTHEDRSRVTREVTERLLGKVA